MHVQSCCFASLNLLLFFCRSRCRRRRRRLSSLIYKWPLSRRLHLALAGAPNRKFWEKDLITTTRHELVKAFWSNLNIFGDLWETFIFSSLSVRLMEQFPASKPVPFPHVSLQTYLRTLLASVGVAIGENSYHQRREGGKWGKISYK